MKNAKSTGAALFVTRGALVGALYVVLTAISTVFGLSSGVIQFRISEMLCILPCFLPEAAIGLFIGCLISNIMAGGILWDVIFGSLATLIGAIGAYLLRKLPKKLVWLATVPTVLANVIIVPPVLVYAYGSTDSYWFITLTVFIGEAVCAGVMGSILYYSLAKTALFKKGN